jgi:hypothetical protein
MTAEMTLGIVLVVLGVVILYFSAIGIAFMWIVKQAHKITDKDTRNNARKP